jgi:putative NADH-flavin reductase
MARINVLGGTGYGGSAVAREAARRGHTVRSFSRRPPEEPAEGVAYTIGSLLDPQTLEASVADADVTFVALSPRGDMAGRVEDIVRRLIERADPAGVRLGVLGGASSLLESEGGPRLFDVRPPPPEVLPEVQTGLDLLEMLRASAASLDWFYVSPAFEFGAWVQAPVTRAYRISDGVLITDEQGTSRISGDDLALAVLDEIEEPRHHRQRFHVAH